MRGGCGSDMHQVLAPSHKLPHRALLYMEVNAVRDVYSSWVNRTLHNMNSLMDLHRWCQYYGSGTSQHLCTSVLQPWCSARIFDTYCKAAQRPWCGARILNTYSSVVPRHWCASSQNFPYLLHGSAKALVRIRDLQYILHSHVACTGKEPGSSMYTAKTLLIARNFKAYCRVVERHGREP